jgi:hypothetical protein
MIEEFYEFLELRGFLERFCYALNGEITAGLNPTMYVNCFAWADTDDGYRFWNDVDVDWNNYLKYWEEELGEKWYENKL